MSARAILALSLVAPCIACGAESTDGEELSTPLAVSEAVCPEAASDRGDLWLHEYDASPVTSVTTDADGDIVIARSGVETAKLDANGQTIWSQPFGKLVARAADGSVLVAGDHDVLTLDADGNVLSTLDLGNDAQIASLAATADGALVVSGPGLGTVKLDASGQRLWSHDFSGQIALDAGGNVVVAGATADATPGGSDVFVAKLDAQGKLLFSRTFGDAGAQQRAEAVAVDAAGNVAVAGVFDGTLGFESGALTLLEHACSSDAWCNTFGFVAQLDAAGTAVWSRSLGPMRAVTGAAADASGSVVLSGTLPGGVRPFRNTWLASFDAQGREAWRRAEWPETGIGAGHAVAIDGCGDVVWSVSARPDLESEERAYLAKLSP